MGFYGTSPINKLNESLEDFGTGARLKIRQRDDYNFHSEEFTTAQTGTQVAPAPGVGKRIVIKGIEIATDASSGEITINGTVNGLEIILAKLYVTKANSLSQGVLNIPLDENTGTTITTTTGNDKVLIKGNSVIDNV